MKELINLVGAYTGELIVIGVGIIIREIETRIMIRRKRREWEEDKKNNKIN